MTDALIEAVTREVIEAAQSDDLRTIIALALEDDYYTGLVVAATTSVAAQPLLARGRKPGWKWGTTSGHPKGSPEACAGWLIATAANGDQDKTARLVASVTAQPTAYVVEVLKELMRVIEKINAAIKDAS